MNTQSPVTLLDQANKLIDVIKILTSDEQLLSKFNKEKYSFTIYDISLCPITSNAYSFKVDFLIEPCQE